MLTVKKKIKKKNRLLTPSGGGSVKLHEQSCVCVLGCEGFMKGGNTGKF